MNYEEKMPPKPILIKNGMIVTVNESSDVYSGDILVKDSIIADLGTELSHSDAIDFDAVIILSHRALFKPMFIFVRRYFAIWRMI